MTLGRTIHCLTSESRDTSDFAKRQKLMVSLKCLWCPDIHTEERTNGPLSSEFYWFYFILTNIVSEKGSAARSIVKWRCETSERVQGARIWGPFRLVAIT